jgi:hypothetical protein
MRMWKASAALAFLGLAVAGADTAAAEQTWRKIGTLDCTMGPSIGLLYGDRQQARCTFSPGPAGDKQRYIGRMSRPGVNLGIAPGSRMIWTVLSGSSPGGPPKSIVGSYGGVCSDIASLRSGGEKALAGGPENSVCLQPVTTAPKRQPNLAFEITTLRLE